MDLSRYEEEHSTSRLYKLTLYRQQAVSAREDGNEQRAVEYYEKSIEEADLFLEDISKKEAGELHTEISELKSSLKRQKFRMESPP